MPLTRVNFAPGIDKQNTTVGAEGRWVECNNVRFRYHLSKRKSEIDFINGRVEIMGEELNIKTPYNFILSSIVRQKELVF